MAEINLRIDSILEGQAPSQYFGQQGTFIASLAIDPDYPISSSDLKTSGFAVPISYAKFSGSNVTSSVLAVINNPKNNKTYIVLSNGRLISYDNTLGSETLIGTVAGGSAGGACYYNNYIYIFGTGASHDDVSRYGPLNNSPALFDAIWKSSTLGSQPALSNTTYPTIQGVSIPNHWGFVHGYDNSLYFLDFESKTGGTSPGQGLVHRIHTKKTTDEGDTNSTTIPSAYGALSLPLGFYPTAIVNVNTNVMIVGILTTDNNINQGKAAFVMWDPTNAQGFFLGPVTLPDTLATAALNTNGDVYIWSGNAQNGVRLSKYGLGVSVSDVLLQEEGFPPFAGAVDSIGSRIVWGGFTSNPTLGSCVWSYGSKDARLPAGLHNIAKTSNSSTAPIVTALKYVQQDSYKQPKMVIAWNDGSGSGLDKYSSNGTVQSVMRWMFNIGQKFEIERIRIPLAGAVDSTTSIQPKVYFDDLTSSPGVSSAPGAALLTINATNALGKRKMLYKGAAVNSYIGQNNFVLELTWSNITPMPVALPILIKVDLKEDEV